MNIIGLMGYAGVGKTTTAQILASLDPPNIVVASFATPLKHAVQDLFLLSDNQVYGDKEQKEKVDPRWGKSPRELLQIIGTDCLRNMIDPDFHIKRMDEYLVTLDTKVVIIDDVRFPDEAEFVNNSGVCFYIDREGYPQTAVDHTSEVPPRDLANGNYVFNPSAGLGPYKNYITKGGMQITRIVLEALNGAC